MSCEEETGGADKHTTSTPGSNTTPQSDLGRLSADLLSQDLELQELKKELSDVNQAFEAFKQDYSQLLTLYNGTNQELQALLHERSMEEPAPPPDIVSADNTGKLLDRQEECRQLEIEKNKYREMYLEAVESLAQPAPMVHTLPDNDTSQLCEQVRDMAEQIQELEAVREELALRLQQHAGEKDTLLHELNEARANIVELESAGVETQGDAEQCREMMNVKNAVIEKLRAEFTELGDENTRLRAQVTKFQESSDNQEMLLNSSNLNQEDIVRDYQALQYRCSETERREQEALLYIKDCLKLVEQTQHEKEQLVIQAAQSENMRLEVEGTLGSIVEEASKRTFDEVERIKLESNKNLALLIGECGMYQARVAELEAELEEATRLRESVQVSESRGGDCVLIADKDAVIFKLREHVRKLGEDKTNLTDQLLDVSNTMRASKEHYESKIRSLQNQLSTTKDKAKRAVQEKELLITESTVTTQELERWETLERGLRKKIADLQGIVDSTERQGSGQLRELQDEEEEKRVAMKKSHSKIVDNLRHNIVEKQNEVNRLQEEQSRSVHLLATKETELNATILTLTKKLKERSSKHKAALSELDKLRVLQEQEREKAFRTESRLKAVDMQLSCANNQVAMVTENEAKLCSRIKELQLKIDLLEFDLQRNKGGSVTGVLNHSNIVNSMQPPVVPLLTSKDRSKSSRKRDKRDRKEKEEISKIFSSDIIRSRKQEKKRASTPQTDKSDTTIKFTDSNYHEELSRINGD